MLRALQREGEPEKPTAPARVAGPERSRERTLRCRACGREICRIADAIEVQGAHAHVFVNPHGLDFHVRLFARADGAIAVGPPSAFFSWFPGHPWRVLVCGRCATHLGWVWGDAAFFGLITDRLSEEPDS